MPMTLLYFLDPEVESTTGTETGETVTHAEERITFLVRKPEKNKEKILR